MALRSFKAKPKRQSLATLAKKRLHLAQTRHRPAKRPQRHGRGREDHAADGTRLLGRVPEGRGDDPRDGDLVLLEDQVSPVMSVALDNGLEVAALRNHFFWESPRILFMHIGGMGEEERRSCP